MVSQDLKFVSMHVFQPVFQLSRMLSMLSGCL